MPTLNQALGAKLDAMWDFSSGNSMPSSAFKLGNCTIPFLLLPCGLNFAEIAWISRVSTATFHWNTYAPPWKSDSPPSKGETFDASRNRGPSFRSHRWMRRTRRSPLMIAVPSSTQEKGLGRPHHISISYSYSNLDTCINEPQPSYRAQNNGLSLVVWNFFLLYLALPGPCLTGSAYLHFELCSHSHFVHFAKDTVKLHFNSANSCGLEGPGSI